MGGIDSKWMYEGGGVNDDQLTIRRHKSTFLVIHLLLLSLYILRRTLAHRIRRRVIEPSYPWLSPAQARQRDPHFDSHRRNWAPTRWALKA